MEKAGVADRRFMFGLFLIVVGFLWVLIRLDVIPYGWTDVLISWQMLLIAIGIFSFIAGNRTAGVILMAIGGYFLVDELIIIPPIVRQLGWPILIIAVGITLLFAHNRSKTNAVLEPSANNSDFFDDFVIFGGKEIFVNSQKFLGGKITAIFGGVDYDFREAILSENGATIDCLCLFGGTGFKLPPDWSVKNEINTVFGGFSDKRKSSVHNVSKDFSKTLVVKGFCAFGGVEVKYS
jgi:predicted membrane protein